MSYYKTDTTGRITVVTDSETPFVKAHFLSTDREIVRNANGALVWADEINADEETAAKAQVAKTAKLAELKAERNKAELLPVNGFDVDETSLMRINIAIAALEAAGEDATLEWTLADNSVQTVTAADLRAVLVALAVQSNAVHERYRELKALVEEATTAEEAEAIQW